MTALGRVMKRVRHGELCEEARWITFSRTIFIGKKGGKAPRPIKVGELLRAIGARVTLNQNERRLRMLLARNNQFGVAVSGASEACIHWRCTVEETIRAGRAPA